jgi:hypothetical protein
MIDNYACAAHRSGGLTAESGSVHAERGFGPGRRPSANCIGFGVRKMPTKDFTLRSRDLLSALRQNSNQDLNGYKICFYFLSRSLLFIKINKVFDPFRGRMFQLRVESKSPACETLTGVHQVFDLISARGRRCTFASQSKFQCLIIVDIHPWLTLRELLKENLRLPKSFVQNAERQKELIRSSQDRSNSRSFVCERGWN